MISIAIIEDNEKIRAFVKQELSDDPEFEVLYDAASVEEFCSGEIVSGELQVLLLDINLPGVSGLEALRSLKGMLPQTDIIIFTIRDNSDDIFKAFCAGASGYLIKSTSIDNIKRGIHNVVNGDGAISPSVARKMIEYFNPRSALSEPLSEQEMQIVQFITDGFSYKLIADKLLISINTVRYHIKKIYRKLHINSKAELISKSNKGMV
jgi:DNA-binding NarL/FixJ family response regulator